MSDQFACYIATCVGKYFYFYSKHKTKCYFLAVWIYKHNMIHHNMFCLCLSCRLYNWVMDAEWHFLWHKGNGVTSLWFCHLWAGNLFLCLTLHSQILQMAKHLWYNGKIYVSIYLSIFRYVQQYTVTIYWWHDHIICHNVNCKKCTTVTKYSHCYFSSCVWGNPNLKWDDKPAV